MKIRHFTLFIITFFLLFVNVQASIVTHSALVPDPTLPGPYTVSSAEYRFPAMKDSDILSDRDTEIWGKVFFPQTQPFSTHPSPLIIMLHGNHPTCGILSNHGREDDSCTYTDDGVCPAGYIVVPNHEGYAYLASHLASWGYWVVSINANRGITCGAGVAGDGGLNLARGKLILKHLSLLYQWNTTGGAPLSLGLGSQGLIGKLDFGQVGLFGHSRGGEGVRAAYNLYLDENSSWPKKIPGLKIQGIYEIGAVDGQTARVLDANGTVWHQLLPLCDGDVYDLEGRHPFERMLLHLSEPVDAQKSIYEVWGANHNFFNTEWQKSDSYHCDFGTPIFDPKKHSSPEQQKIAVASVTAFFRTRLGDHTDIQFNQYFNPYYSLPSLVEEITPIHRDFSPSPNAAVTTIFEDFNKATGTNTSGNSNRAQNITLSHHFLTSPQRVANIQWGAANNNVFFESIWTAPGQGRDVSELSTLDIRLARQSHKFNKEPTTDFDVQLEDISGQLSAPLQLSKFMTLTNSGTFNQILQTVRIPVSSFQNVRLDQIRGIRFTFNRTTSGAIYLANIRFHKDRGLGGALPLHSATSQRFIDHAMYSLPRKELAVVPAHLNTLSLHRVAESPQLKQAAIEIRIASSVPFPPLDKLAVLTIGDKPFTLSRYIDTTGLRAMAFTLSLEDYQALNQTAEVRLINGKIWKFGSLAQAKKYF